MVVVFVGGRTAWSRAVKVRVGPLVVFGCVGDDRTWHGGGGRICLLLVENICEVWGGCNRSRFVGYGCVQEKFYA